MTDTSKIVDRIRKLLRLARDKGGTESERSSALAMASKLMLEHNLENIDPDDDTESKLHIIKGEHVGQGLDRTWHLFAAQAVGTLFTCRVLVMGDRAAYRFVGISENVEACNATFEHVVDQIEALYKQALKAFDGTLGKSGRAELRATFKEACALRLLHRAKEIIAVAKNQIPDHRALVVVDQTLSKIDDFLSDVPTGKAVTTRKHGIGTVSGYRAGGLIRLQGEMGGEKAIAQVFKDTVSCGWIVPVKDKGYKFEASFELPESTRGLFEHEDLTKLKTVLEKIGLRVVDL